MKRKSNDSIAKIFTKEIVFETKSGSIGISTEPDGKLKIGALRAPGTANTLVIDPINNKIQTSEITFTDGTYIDSAANIGSGGSGGNVDFFNLKANKLFFKYDSEGAPIPNQVIELKIQKSSNIGNSISFSFSPNPLNNINLTQVDSTTWNLPLSEFEKASSDILLITAIVGTRSDSVSVFKTTDGVDALVGALTNPLTTIPVESNGTITNENLQNYLTNAGGQFSVFKGGDELTGNTSKVTYSVFSVTEGLSISINSSGVYTINSFDVSEELGQAILMATDNITGQQFKTKLSIITVKKGAQGQQGPIGLTGPTGASGPAGSAGINAKVVKLTVDDAQIAYSASDLYPSPKQIQLTASQQNHVGNVFYEFIVYEAGQTIGTTLVNSTSNTLLLTDTNKNYGSNSYTFINSSKTDYKKSKTIKVCTREGSSTGTIISEDSVNIIATKDGSDSLEIVFPNNNHTFVAAANGEVSSYSGGGSIVEAYIGNEQLAPISTTDTLTNGKFKVTVSDSSNITTGAITVGTSNRMNVADPTNMTADNASITYLISAIDSKGTSKSQLVKATFSKAKKGDAGANALNGLLTNETHTIAAENDGKIYNFNSNPLSDAGGSFKVYLGDNLLVNNVTYSISGSVTPTTQTKNGLTISINSSGIYSLSTSNASSWTSASETFTLKATYNGVDILKTFTITKSFGGANAKLIKLISSSQTFKKDTNGLYSPSSQTISLTALLQNITTAVTWSVDGTNISSLGSNVSLVDSNNITISQNQFTNLLSAGKTSITVRASSDTFYDEVTLQTIQDGVAGSSAKTISVSVDSQIFSFNNSSDTVAVPSSITVTINQQNLSSAIISSNISILNSSGQSIAVPTFTSQNVTNGTGITIFSLPYNSANLNNKAKLPITIEVTKDSVSDKISIYKVDGGADGATVILTNESHTFQAASNGSVSSFTGGGTDISVYIGTTQLTADATTTGFPSANNSFSVAVDSIFPANFITLGAKSASGTKMTFADPTAISSSVDGGTVKYLIKVKDSTGTTRTFEKIQSFSKSKEGQQGIQGTKGDPGSAGNNARAVELVSSRYQIPYDSNNSTSVSSFVLTATAKNTSGTLTYKFFKNDVAIDASPISSNTKTISTNLPSPNTSATYKVELYEGGVLVATDSVSIIGTKDGSDAVTLSVPNNNHTFTCDVSGNVQSYTDSGTTIQVFVGNTALTAISSATSFSASGGQFKVSAAVSPVGSIVVGNITVSSTTATVAQMNNFTADNATITYTITYRRPNSSTDETITQVATYSKSKVGANGIPGTNAKSIAISVDKQIFSFQNSNATTPTPTSVAVTINQQNLSTAIVAADITIRDTNNATIATPALTTNVTNGNGTVTFTLPYSSINDKTKFPVKITVSKESTSDEYSLYSVVGGTDAATIAMSNEAHVFQASNAGAVTNFDGSGTDLKIFIGSTELTPSTSTADPSSNNSFTVTSRTITPAGFVTFAASDRSIPTGTNILRFAAVTAVNTSTDTGYITYTIKAKDSTGTLRTFTKDQVFTKSKEGIQGQQGQQGLTGDAGADGIDTSRIWDFNQTFQYDAATLVPYGWNITPSSSIDLTAANVSANVLAPKFEPSGGYNYPYLSGSGYAGRFGGLPIGITVTSSVDSKYGGKVGLFCIQSLSSSAGTNQAYVYSGEPIPISTGNTYELAFRVKQNTAFTSTQIGLFFFDINGSLITNIDTNTSTINYAQTSFPHVATTINSGDQNWTADRIVNYYSFETGGSLKTFPSNAKYVKPYARIEFITGGSQGSANIRQLLIDYLYFGEKTTPNSRTGIWIDPITGRVTIGEANADVTGGSGGLTDSKYDASANLEIVSSASINEVADIKITQGHKTFKYDETKRGADFAAIRFAGWTGVYTGATSASNMILDERAEIRATYCLTGSESNLSGAKGGAAIDFYTAPARTSIGYGGIGTSPPTSPLLRARITDQGQLLVGYDDTSTLINTVNPVINRSHQYNSTLGWYTSTTTYLYSNTETYPKLAVSGGIIARNIVTYDSNVENYITGTTYADVVNPTPNIKSYADAINNLQGGISDVYNDNTGKSLGTPRWRWEHCYADTIQLSDDVILTYPAGLGLSENKRVYTRWKFDCNLVVGSTSVEYPTATTSSIRFYVTDGTGSNSRIDENVDDSETWDSIADIRAPIGSSALTVLNFTGQHRNIPKDDISNYENKIGLIVVSAGVYDDININEALPYVELSDKRKQKNVFGVLSDKEDLNSTIREYQIGAFVSLYKKQNNEDDTKLIINSLGEGAIWVCNINGNLENGDYITTCEVPGYGMKQDDDLLHNYTVAKITCDCNFDLNSPIYICEEFEFNGNTYRRAFVGCTYHCG